MQKPAGGSGGACCLRWCRSNYSETTKTRVDAGAVKLDTCHMGQDAVILKNGRRICGQGAALANHPVSQDKAYFEVKVQSGGIYGVGLSTRRCNLNSVPLGNCADSWVLRHDGSVYHAGRSVASLAEAPQDGDVIGVSYDHIEMNFFKNGVAQYTPITGMKGTVFPVVYVGDGAIIDVHFAATSFEHPAPSGFQELMFEKQIL